MPKSLIFRETCENCTDTPSTAFLANPEPLVSAPAVWAQSAAVFLDACFLSGTILAAILIDLDSSTCTAAVFIDTRKPHGELLNVSRSGPSASVGILALVRHADVGLFGDRPGRSRLLRKAGVQGTSRRDFCRGRSFRSHVTDPNPFAGFRQSS